MEGNRDGGEISRPSGAPAGMAGALPIREGKDLQGIAGSSMRNVALRGEGGRSEEGGDHLSPFPRRPIFRPGEAGEKGSREIRSPPAPVRMFREGSK